MSWDGTAWLFLLSIAPQLILLPISLSYYYTTIKPNKDKLFWKIRRPRYFLFYIIITLINDIIRCSTGLLLHINIISPYFYSLISVPLAYFGGITWGSIRLWLLYYDIKSVKKNHLLLLSKHLTTNTYPISSKKCNKMKQYQAVTMKVFVLVIIFCIITLLIDIVLGLIGISKLLLYCFIFCLLIFYTYFLLKLCCHCCTCTSSKHTKDSLESSPFRDDWLLLLELTIIWIIWIIGTVGAIALFPLRGETIYPALIAMLTMITRVIITLTMLILPYRISLRLNKCNGKSVTLSSLKKTLSTKSYFYSFVQHLVQEFAIENLTFLVEIWQFKYQEKYNLKPSKMSEKLNIEIDKTNESKETKESKTSSNTDWFKDVTVTVDHDDILSAGLSSISSNVIQADTVEMSKFLESLPWQCLPLAQSICVDDDNKTVSKGMAKKWQQCYIIFTKYLDENSYDAINVSYTTRNEIYAKYYTLFHYKQCKNDDDLQNSNACLPPFIQTDEEFKENIVKIFDVAIDDIVHNLRDSFSRFVHTEEFKLAH